MSREEKKGGGAFSPMSGSAGGGAGSGSGGSTTFGTITLSKEEESEFREIFNLVDRDRGGSISKVRAGVFFCSFVYYFARC